ncbi:MAG: hypothetical protein WBD01_13995 [Salaquimonas sp.]
MLVIKGIVVSLLAFSVLNSFSVIKAFAQSYVGNNAGSCLSPEEPYPFKLAKSDPLYEASRDEHQAYLENLESYINCLDLERRNAIHMLGASFDLFRQNFGADGVFRFSTN